MPTAKTSPTTYHEPPDGQSGLAARAMAYHKETLRSQLEPEHDGKGLAVHPDSGDYAIAETPTHASRALWQRHPEGGIVSMRIGPAPDFALSARILAGRMAAKFQESRQTEPTPTAPSAKI